MAYSVADITELIHYHLVLAEPDDEARNRCPHCGNKGVPVGFDVRRWRTLGLLRPVRMLGRHRPHPPRRPPPLRRR